MQNKWSVGDLTILNKQSQSSQGFSLSNIYSNVTSTYDSVLTMISYVRELNKLFNSTPKPSKSQAKPLGFKNKFNKCYSIPRHNTH